jgi:hypothetical protein
MNIFFIYPLGHICSNLLEMHEILLLHITGRGNDKHPYLGVVYTCSKSGQLPSLTIHYLIHNVMQTTDSNDALSTMNVYVLVIFLNRGEHIDLFIVYFKTQCNVYVTCRLPPSLLPHKPSSFVVQIFSLR